MSNLRRLPDYKGRMRLTAPVVDYSRPAKPPSRAFWFGIGFISALMIVALIGLITS